MSMYTQQMRWQLVWKLTFSRECVEHCESVKTRAGGPFESTKGCHPTYILKFKHCNAISEISLWLKTFQVFLSNAVVVTFGIFLCTFNTVHIITQYMYVCTYTLYLRLYRPLYLRAPCKGQSYLDTPTHMKLTRLVFYNQSLTYRKPQIPLPELLRKTHSVYMYANHAYSRVIH